MDELLATLKAGPSPATAYAPLRTEASAHYIATISDSLFDALITTDADHRIVSWNAAAERLYGWRLHEVQGQYAAGLIGPEFPGGEEERQSFYNALKEDGRWQGEVMQRTRDGRTIIALSSVSALTDRTGKYMGAVVLNRDITAQKKAETSLRESEQRLRAIFSQAAVGVCLISTDCTIFEVNPKFCEIVGYSREELLNNSCMAMTHPDDRAANQAILDEFAATAADATTFEKRYVRKNNTHVWVRTTVTKIRDPHENVQHYVALVEDISGKKQTELALRESEATFRILADNILHLAWMAEPDGRVFWFNQRFYEFTGAVPMQVTGNGWKALCHPSHSDLLTQKLNESLSTHEPWEITFPMRDASYNYRWFLTRAYPVKERSGKLLRWIITSTDIDEQKSLSENLELLVAERTRELKRSNEDLRQFAHVASHDLKEPVRKIKTFLSLITDYHADTLVPETRRYVDRIEKATERIRSMIDGVLDYSGINGSQKPVEQVDLKLTLDNVLTDLELLIEQKQATVTVGDLPQVEGAAVLLHQLFYNLVYNSLKFSKDDMPPHIHITAIADEFDSGVRTVVRVQDNGIGFSQEFSEKIFDTFVRLNSRDKYDGTGLGLSLCKKIAERHGGNITANGVPGSGAIFDITLPFNQKRRNI